MGGGGGGAGGEADGDEPMGRVGLAEVQNGGVASANRYASIGGGAAMAGVGKVGDAGMGTNRA